MIRARHLAPVTFLAVIGVATAAQAQSLRTFFTDFDSGPPPEFSGVTTLASVEGFDGLGPAGRPFYGNLLHNDTGGADSPTGRVPGSPTRLTLADLPLHTSVDLNFLLAVINTWDDFGGGQRDVLHVSVDGRQVFAESFDFGSAERQSYQPPADGLLTPRGPGGSFHDRGFDNNHGDGGYDMGREPAFHNIPHTAPTLIVEINAGGTDWSGGNNESWGIDNFEVYLNGVIPEPTGMGLLGLGPLLLARRRPS